MRRHMVVGALKSTERTVRDALLCNDLGLIARSGAAESAESLCGKRVIEHGTARSGFLVPASPFS